MARTRPLIVELDEGENLYICRNCYTHIGYAGLLTHIDFSPQGSGLTGDKFQEVVNVRGHSRTRRDVGFYTIKDVHCRNCIDHLGWEFVEIRGGRLHHNRFGIYPAEYLMIPYRLAILIDDSPEPMQPGQVRQ